MRYLHRAENQLKVSRGHTVPGPEYLVVGRLNASMVVSITLLRAWCRLAVGGAPEKKFEMDCRNGMLFFRGTVSETIHKESRVGLGQGQDADL